MIRGIIMTMLRAWLVVWSFRLGEGLVGSYLK